MKVLVVYYSRTGNTRLVAEAIAKSLISGYEALFGKLAEIEEVEKNPENYDLVVIGSPVWAGRLSSPVRTYLSMYGDKIENVASSPRMV